MPKLTKLFISSIKPPGKWQVIYRDSALPGLGFRVTPKSMSYVVEARVNGSFRRVTLCKEWQLTPTEARKKAMKVLAIMASGGDPTAEKAKRRIRGATLQEVLNHFLSVRILKPNTVRTYRQMVPRCLGDWLDLPVTAITRDMVEQRHMSLRKLTQQGTSGEAQANTVMNILGTLLNFASANYEIDGKPILLVKSGKEAFKQSALVSKPQTTEHHSRSQAAWYAAVMDLRQQKVKDYLMLLLLTGLRRIKGASLRWEDIDFHSKVLRVRAELAKNGNEHRLPLSDYLYEMLQRRYLNRGDSKYVFPRQGRKHHMVDSDHVIDGVAAKADCVFILHALRTFLTVAERLALPYVVFKSLPIILERMTPHLVISWLT